ncbi:MAG: hypothetical protein PWR01_2778 [Clostridiales bacterium]|jgi:hypothetical protein|nr:hypothetical protein [Clostridiales bacterium]MDN5281705.1 hypothetical protein [Candidatus Ozemobacter sp.]
MIEENEDLNTSEYSEESENDENPAEKSTFLDRVENEFDWNLIGIVSIWLFLFATAFLIF